MPETKSTTEEESGTATAIVEEIEVLEETDALELTEDDLDAVSGGVHFDPAIPRTAPELTPKSFDVPLIANNLGDTSFIKRKP